MSDGSECISIGSVVVEGIFLQPMSSKSLVPYLRACRKANLLISKCFCVRIGKIFIAPTFIILFFFAKPLVGMPTGEIGGWVEHWNYVLVKKYLFYNEGL